MNIKTFYQGRYLPHVQPIGATFFVTFHLEGSISNGQIRELVTRHNLERINCIKKGINDKLLEQLSIQQFYDYDKLLDQKVNGPTFLKGAKIANLVSEQIMRFDGQFYDLLAYCIMSNHVHILIDTSVQLIGGRAFDNFVPLDKIMQRIKGASSRYCNLALGSRGRFWALESYDHYVRNEKSRSNILAYILNNPVKAGLIKDWQDWEFSYYRQL